MSASSTATVDERAAGARGSGLTVEECERLLGQLGHQLRTPLSSVMILTELLSEDPGGTLTAPQLDQLGKVRQATDDALALLGGTVELVRALLGKPEVAAAPVSLERLAAALQEGHRARASGARASGGARGRRLRCTIDPELPAAPRLDRGHLQRILDLLLGGLTDAAATDATAAEVTAEDATAADATPAGPDASPVELRFAPHREPAPDGRPRLLVTLADPALSLPPAVAAGLLEPFDRDSMPVARGFGAGGVGAALAAALAALLGGSLTLASADGAGTHFQLIVPFDGG